MARNRPFSESDPALPSDGEPISPAPDPADLQPAADAASTEPAAPVVVAEEKPKRFVVAPGCELVGARGKLGPGSRIRAGEFTSEQLDGFVRDGHVVVEA
jgi:hypothetical protein